MLGSFSFSCCSCSRKPRSHREQRCSRVALNCHSVGADPSERTGAANGMLQLFVALQDSNHLASQHRHRHHRDGSDDGDVGSGHHRGHRRRPLRAEHGLYYHLDTRPRRHSDCAQGDSTTEAKGDIRWIRRLLETVET
jgi:hypothetical protein